MKIRIISPSDTDHKHPEWWSDYWIKIGLEEEFKNRKYDIVQKDGELDLFLFGNFSWGYKPTAKRRFCWLNSHPNQILIQKDTWLKFGKQFEHIFVMSYDFIDTVKRDFPNSSVLLGGTSKVYQPRDSKPKYDIMFVGNCAKPERVEIMKYLVSLKKYKIAIAGIEWEEKLGELIQYVDYLGPYFDNRKLVELFNSSKLSFYVTSQDMKQHGFVAMRVLDIVAGSDCLCIPDVNLGLKDIFEYVPTFETKEDLVEHLDWYLERPVECDNDLAAARDFYGKDFTFKKVVDEIEKLI